MNRSLFIQFPPPPFGQFATHRKLAFFTGFLQALRALLQSQSLEGPNRGPVRRVKTSKRTSRSWPHEFVIAQSNESNRLSVQDIRIEIFSVENFKLINKHTLSSVRLKIVSCPNCSIDIPEIGRVVGEIFLFTSRTLRIVEAWELASDKNDPLCGLLSPRRISSAAGCFGRKKFQLVKW